MKKMEFDCVVIGGGAAGMAAALELDAAGFSCAIIEREDHLGGILMQCIHNGFGLHEFKEELTGPEFAQMFIEKIDVSNVSVFLNTTVTNFGIHGVSASLREISCISPNGAMVIHCKAIILAMGCREKNRGNIRIPGSRPAGVYTAGLAQRLVNIEGYIPGKEIVVIGSGDIGLIMARRMSWVGCKVKAVVEIMPYPAGLERNIVQCLKDFDIPLYLSCQTTSIFGNDRVEGVEITPMENGVLVPEKKFKIDCDTVLLSVGLVPENELSKTAGVELNPVTNGAVVNWNLMTNIEGVFACGNVLHVHDLVDWVCEESRRAGKHAVEFLNGKKSSKQIPTKAGQHVRYVNPGFVSLENENIIYLRSMIVKSDAVLEIKYGNTQIMSKKFRRVQPSEMINVKLTSKDLKMNNINENEVLEFSIK